MASSLDGVRFPRREECGRSRALPWRAAALGSGRLRGMSASLSRVGVVGLGTMGAGIAEVLARGGYSVVGVEVGDDAMRRGQGHLDNSTGKAVKRGKLSEDERRA